MSNHVDKRSKRTRSIFSFMFAAVQIGSLPLLMLIAGSTPTFAQAAAVATAPGASFAGTVLHDVTEKPLANAEVVFVSLNRSVRSDSAGNFLFSGLPLGTHTVTVRLVGFESFTTNITLMTAKTVEADLMLKPTTTQTLATVETKATATKGPWAIKLQEFDERRASGTGRYLTADYFESKGGRPLSAFLLEKIPGAKFISMNGARWLASARGCTNQSCGMPGSPRTALGEPIPKGCYMKVIVNGTIRYDGSPGQQMFDIDQLNSQDIIGLEFYTTATTPVQYNSTGGSNQAPCGTIIVWTKGG